MIDENNNHIDDRIEKMLKKIAERRDSVFARFPIIFSLLITFGVVATYYGLEKIIDTNAWLAQNPWYVFGSGVLTLVLTGALYKKLN